MLLVSPLLRHSSLLPHSGWLTHTQGWDLFPEALIAASLAAFVSVYTSGRVRQAANYLGLLATTCLEVRHWDGKEDALDVSKQNMSLFKVCDGSGPSKTLEFMQQKLAFDWGVAQIVRCFFFGEFEYNRICDKWPDPSLPRVCLAQNGGFGEPGCLKNALSQFSGVVQASAPVRPTSGFFQWIPQKNMHLEACIPIY